MVRKFSDSIRQSLWAIMSCAATFPTGNAAYASCLSLEDKQAESSSMPDSANEKDSVRVAELDEYTVVSDRVRKEVISSAPVFNLSNERMKTIGVTDISDALHRLPGLNIKDYGGAGGMRTVSVRGFGANHTGVIYDGIVLSDCQSGKIDLSRYSLDNVGGLSVTIGDNGDIFIPAKASASAASIVISTMSVPAPNDSAWHLTAQFRAGSWRFLNPYLKLGKTLTKNLSCSLIGEFTHAKNNYPFTLHNGVLVTRERRNNSRMNSGHGELNVRWRPTQASTLDGKIYYYDNDRQLPGAVVLYNPVVNERLRDRNFFSQLTYRNLSLEKFSFQWLAKFNWDASLYHDENGKYPGGVLDENYYQREAYFSASALYLPSDKLSFNYSADYSYNNLNSNQPATVEVKPRRHSILQSFTGKFKNSRMQAMVRLLWSVYDNEVKYGESAKDESRLSPSASVSFQPFWSLFFIRASYKNIFRMPTFNDNYYFRMGSVSLKPEDSNQVNLGFTYQMPAFSWLSAAVFTADAYYNTVKNKIVAIPQNMYIWSMMNLGKARAFGMDITANATFHLLRNQSLVFASNYSWQRVQPRTNPADPDYNKQVAYTPQHSGAASISWQNPWADVVFHATGVSERYGTNANLPVTRIKGYIECGATLMRTFRFHGYSLDLRFDLLNIFDKQYEVVVDYPMPGRSWKATATFEL
ncbi:MAG: TonB-dependent receptor plug domain-containing protein [Muribaculaceae bacterium]